MHRPYVAGAAAGGYLHRLRRPDCGRRTADLGDFGQERSRWTERQESSGLCSHDLPDNGTGDLGFRRLGSGSQDQRCNCESHYQSDRRYAGEVDHTGSSGHHFQGRRNYGRVIPPHAGSRGGAGPESVR